MYTDCDSRSFKITFTHAFNVSSFQNLYLNVFCYFHPTQIFVKTLIYLQALAGSGSCVIACTPPQTIRWKFQKYSASLIKLELLFFYIYLSVRQQQAVQSFVPLSVCLFFEAASSFTITFTRAFTVSSFQSLNSNVVCSSPVKILVKHFSFESRAGSGSCVISCTPGPSQTIRWRLQGK